MWPWMHSSSKRTGAMQGPGTHTIYPRTGTVHWSSVYHYQWALPALPHVHVPYLSCVRYKLVLSSIWTNSRVANRMAIFDLIEMIYTHHACISEGRDYPRTIHCSSVYPYVLTSVSLPAAPRTRIVCNLSQWRLRTPH